MKSLLVIIISAEVLLAWWLSRHLRISKNRVSTLELFILAHFPLIALGVYSCSYYYSWASLKEAWILALYVPLALLGALLGTAGMRLLIPGKSVGRRIEASAGDRSMLSTCLTCFVLTLFGLWALSMDPRSLTELMQTARTERWVSSVDQLPIKHLNQVLIVPVIVLFASLFVQGGGCCRLRKYLFLFSTAGFAFSCLLALSRGRLFQALIALCLVAWYLGSRKVRRVVILSVLMVVILFGPLSVALWKYRDTLDMEAALQAAFSSEWMGQIGDDPTFECTDVCLAVLQEYQDPKVRRYVDGITPLLFFYIPRRVWTEKPVVFGPLVWREVLGGQGEVIGVGPTFIGEAYATAGEWGIFLGALILGALLVFYEHLCLRYLRPWEAMGMIAVVLIPAATIVRGDFHSAFIMRFVVYPLAYFSVLFSVRTVLGFFRDLVRSKPYPQSLESH